MKKFKIYAGLGGGFGGADYHGIHEFVDEDDAFDHARLIACEDYESYAGMHGLRSYEDIYQDFVDEGIEDIYESDIEYEYEQERDSWLDYFVEEVPDDYIEGEDDE
jgi:hypothetical protein